ncbi:phospholipase D family protein [Lysobacter solisilvae (ex Woo and Kim 2020)]|uniref:Phospholipase D family protein n=1 Tax=Agrilutibacter terrestris TaxID=2865112 RepID=A0A7H0FWU0_9GAMM|nr:phospholipase D family protein [Lysobacter terrestris]QNP40506.1 phospholipase D family protein [Lysobacter terrestris]
MRRALRILGWGLLTLVLLTLSGWLLADRLTPPATGQPSHALPVQAAQTELDRELAPLLATQPGKTGAILVPGGLDAFAARAISARRAGRSLDLQYYIWHDDLTGRLLGREAWQAAERGVRVRMLLDDMNAEGLDPGLLALDAHPNLEIRLYNPFRNRGGMKRVYELVQRVVSVNHRMHNKAWIADGRMAVVGGRNIGVEYFDAGEDTNFRDLDLVLFGPAVAQASSVFDAYWNSTAAVPIAALSRKDPKQLQALMAQVEAEAASPAAQRYLQRVEASKQVRAYFAGSLQPRWSEGVRVVADPPLKWQSDDRSGWMVEQLTAKLRGAQRKALLISPYFVPGEFGTDGLGALATRGVHVGVITNSLAANDVPAVHSGYARYREPLLAAGVRLYEIRAQGRPETAGIFGSSGASLHTKAFVVDDARGFVGSFNLDPRSADLNTEMGVLFDDPVIASELRDEYLRLASPALSYWVYRRPDGALRWLDRAAQPPLLLDHEPDTSRMQRATATVAGWLPIESQL